MNQSTPSLAAEIAALKEFYAALNRNDIESAVKSFDALIAWMLPIDYPTGGNYQGLEAVKALLSRSRANWAEGSCDPEKYFAAGDKIAVFIAVHVRLKTETEWRTGRHAAAWTFRNGKAIEMRIFDDTQQALEWVGVNDSDGMDPRAAGTRS